jgi:chromosome segregation ATPase
MTTHIGPDQPQRIELYHHIELPTALLAKVDLLLTRTEKIMSALTDLKAALDDLATQLVVNNAEIETLLTKITTPGTSDADVEAAVTQIRSLITDNAAEVAKAQAAAP